MIETSISDPVFEVKEPTIWHGIAVPPGWYFWDETWADWHGPYTSEAIARGEFSVYCQVVLGVAPLDNEPVVPNIKGVREGGDAGA
jgi:hypothetical protein